MQMLGTDKYGDSDIKMYVDGRRVMMIKKYQKTGAEIVMLGELGFATLTGKWYGLGIGDGFELRTQ